MKLLSVALLPLRLAGAARRYEHAARLVSERVGRGDLVVHSSVSNWARGAGRTVRFTVPGDPIAMVPLSFSTPTTCASGGECGEVMRENLAYATGQSAYAARVVAAFEPCGFHSLSNLELINRGLAWEHQWVSVAVFVRQTLTEANAEETLALVERCAMLLAAGDRGRHVALDDVAEWGARPVLMTVFLSDLSDFGTPVQPLILGWQQSEGTLRNTRHTVTSQSLRLEGGVATASPLKVEPPLHFS